MEVGKKEKKGSQVKGMWVGEVKVKERTRFLLLCGKYGCNPGSLFVHTVVLSSLLFLCSLCRGALFVHWLFGVLRCA